MHISTVNIKDFRRFTDLTITDIPKDAKLVILAGPNGTGKSSIFDAFRTWHGINSRTSNVYDENYHKKLGGNAIGANQHVTLSFHETLPEDRTTFRKFFYYRTAYRNDADFTFDVLRKQVSPLTEIRISRLIDNDASVSTNYQSLVSQSVSSIYDGQHDQETIIETRERIIGKIRDSISNIFPDLILSGLGDPLSSGSFYFTKGISHNFHYKNLSGGEKAVLDLILDLVVKLPFYDDTVFCIDEPETHLNTRVQSTLLQEIYNLVPDRCQLWIASHSIGMMRQARDLKDKNPECVSILDMEGHDFDSPVVLRPVPVDRDFWGRILAAALGDLASLVAPKVLVLCEGAVAQAGIKNAEFDSVCYRNIFKAEYPDVDFISVGNQDSVRSDQLGIARAVQTITPGTKVLQLIDRDDLSEQEVNELLTSGTRVLSRRTLESYLFDDEVLGALCDANGRPEVTAELVSLRNETMLRNAEKGFPPDDVKSAAGTVYDRAKRILSLKQPGNTAAAFQRDTLSHLVPGTEVYRELRASIFGE